MPVTQRLTATAFAAGLVATIFVSCGKSGSGSGGAAFSTVAPTASAPTSVTSGTTGVVTPGVAVASSTSTNGVTVRTKTARVIARAGEGFLEDQGGQLILHVKGTPYERGLQYGELVGDRIEHAFRVMEQVAKTSQNVVPASLVPLLTVAGAQIYKPHFPPDVLDMMKGVVAGAQRRNPPASFREDDLIFLNAIIDLGATVQVPSFKCSGHAVWGPLSDGGKMFQLRNIDLFVGTGLESHALVVIEKPANGKTFLNAGYAGMLGSASGMNEHGIGVSQVWAFSHDSVIGQPWILTARKLLESAENVDAVYPLFSSVKRTYGANFVFADRGDGRSGKPRAIALESTGKMLAQFDDNDPREDAAWNGNSLPIRMPFAVFRGDTAMSAAIYNRHYSIGPGQDPRTRGGYKDRYKQQADMTADYAARGVKIGGPEMIAISRKIGMDSGSLQCAVYENHDLVAHIANSRVVPGGQPVMAKAEPFHRYDLDYYLPTIKATTDRGTFTSGDTVTLKVTVDNRGRPRRLDVRAWLEVGGASISLSPGPIGTVEAIAGKSAVASSSFKIPANTPKGLGRVMVELDETGGHDVVDYAAVAVSVN